MGKIRAMRAESAIPVALLMLAISVFASYWFVAMVMRTDQCPFGSCVLHFFGSGPFWARLLLALLVTATVLLAVTPEPRPYKQGRASRFWPVYLLLGLVLLQVGWGWLNAWIFMQLLPSHYDAASLAALQLYMLFSGVLALPEIVIALIVWQLVSWLCFARPEQQGDRSRGRHALLFYLVFATLLAVLLSLFNFFLGHADDLDYSRVMDTYEELTGVSVDLAFVGVAFLMALPVWGIAYWRESGGRGSVGTVLAAVAAVLISLAVFAASLIESVVLLEGVGGSAAVLFLSLILVLWWLLLNAFVAWFVCWVARPLGEDRKPVSPLSVIRLTAAAACAAVVFCILGIVGIVIGAKTGGVGSAQQPRTLVAEGLLSEQEAGYQNGDSCAGVVRAGGTLWLIGMDDYGLFSSFHEVPEKTDAYDFVERLPKLDGPTDYTVASDQVTVLSRLTDDHRFKAITYLPGWACLQPVPGTDKLVLQTELSRWNGTNLTVEDEGTFQSVDGGRSWTWVDPGMASHVYGGAETPAFEGGDIKRLEHTRSGSAYAVIRRPPEGDTVIARADAESARWTILGALPNPFWFLGQVQADGLWASNDVLVVEVDVEFVPPQLEGAESWDEVEFEAEGTYYSADQGAHWHRLGISDYPGVLGVDPVTDLIYFGGDGDSVMALDVTFGAAESPE